MIRFPRLYPSIIERYVGKYVVVWILYITLFFTVISWLIKFMEQLSNVGRGTFTITTAMLAVSMKIPTNVYAFFPLSALMGTVVSLCLLGSRSELVIMQSAGISKLKIVTATLKFSIPLMACVLLLSEYVIPYTEAKYDEIRIKSIKGTDISVGSAGDVWLKEENKFMHITWGNSEGKVGGVSLYIFDPVTHQLIDYSVASDGAFTDGKWEFKNVTHKYFRDDKLEITHTNEEKWPISLTPDKFNVFSVSADELPISSLWSYVRYLHKNNVKSEKYEFELYRKIFLPIAIITMICLAGAVAFGSMRSLSMSARIVVGVVVGFTFYIANQIISPISMVYGCPPILAVLTPSIIFFIIGIYYLKKR